MRVLGVSVGQELLASWATWLAPDPQPFLYEDSRFGDVASDDGDVTPELRDTYRLWGGTAKLRRLWLSEERFRALPRKTRAALVREQVRCGRGAVPAVRAWSDLVSRADMWENGDGHRFVLWPSLVAANRDAILERAVSTDRLASRHHEVDKSTWRACERWLPRARELAGSFPDGSTTCCFDTVIAATGADEPHACDALEPFERWLSRACRRGGAAGRLGSVLVWRTVEGELVHAAVSIGDGWVLEKPSQDWHSPRAIVTERDVVRTTRLPGQRLERHTLIP